MNEWFRYVRLGVVDILGITVPGILLIVFSVAGFLLPLTFALLHATKAIAQSAVGADLSPLLATWESNKALLFLLGIILAYILGYILRLVSPNKLDKESARHVLAELGPEEVKHWPIQDVGADKFPYLHFRHYLEYRGHKDLLPLVPWGPGPESDHVKSSTHIQTMKLRVLSKAPEIAALLESREAHIRLLSGTWGAIRSTRWLVYAGVGMSVLGLTTTSIFERHDVIRPNVYGVCLLVSGTLAMMMEWSKRTIERLFHYQRVRELFLIVASAHQVDQIGRTEQQKRKTGDGESRRRSANKTGERTGAPADSSSVE